MPGVEDVEALPGYRHAKFAARPKGSTDYLQGAVVAMDPASGDVRALVGGRDYRESSFDRVIDGMRQPGSAFKPIVYAAAIADSLTASTIIPDTAIAIPLDRGRVYRPDNSDNQFLGPITMREALAKSRNVVAVQLAEHVGHGHHRALGAAVRDRCAGRAVSRERHRRVRTAAAGSGWRVHGVRKPRCARRPAIRLSDRGSGRERRVHEPCRAAARRDRSQGRVHRARHDARGRRARHRDVGATVPARNDSGCRKDRHDERQQRRVVRRHDAGAGGRRLAGIRQTEDDHGRCRRRDARRADLRQDDGGVLRGSGCRPSGRRRKGSIVAQLDRVSGQLADSTTPPERRYTEYFLEGTEPFPLRVNGWQLFKNGPIVF